MTSEPVRDDPGFCAGDVLAGKYRIDEILGIGGMGVVVAAHHLQLDDKVAIKFLLPRALRNEEAVARFQQEARAAVKIKSEHAARIIDVGTLENGAPYMVMEHLDGWDLDAWVRERGPLDPEQAVEFVLHACEAMAEAHALGIVHRDLKPANLLCIRRSDGLLSVKVLDFGISKVIHTGSEQDDPTITQTQSLLGSPMYMSPEQLRSSKHVDQRADIWSLGVILFELIAGRPPFSADTMPQLVLKVMTAPAPALRDARADVPAGLEQVILHCLEKDKENRYATVAELAADLSPFGPDRVQASVDRISRVIQAAGMSATQVASLPPDRLADPAGSVAPWMQPGAPSSGRKKAAAAVAVVAVAALLLGAALLMRGPPTPKHAGEVHAASAPTAPADPADPPADPATAASMPSSTLSNTPESTASSAPPAASASASAASTARVPVKKIRVPSTPSSVHTAPASAYDPLDHL